jgi:raffinose/stachyose/melibiose transport system substrate-binding protein
MKRPDVKRFLLVPIIIFALASALILASAGTPEEEKAAPARKPGEKVILTVWDQWEYYGMTAAGPAIDKIHKAFEKEYPDVIMSRSVFGGGFPIRNAVELALTSGEAPDVFYSWPSGAGLTVYAHAGYLQDLTPYADKYGWWDKIPEWALMRNTFKGKLYAYPWEKDLEFVYYNKEIFEELGISEPKTYDQFIEICEKAKRAGYIPISFGNLALWPAVNNFTDLATLIGGRQLVVDVLQNKEKWNNPELVECLEIMKEWGDKGYFTPGFNGVDYNDALMDLYAGKAAMCWTVTWVIHGVIANMEDNVGIFYFPQIKDDKPLASHTSEGSAYYIWSGSKIPDVAAEYINFITQDRFLKTWIEDGFTIPIRKEHVDYYSYDIHPVVQEAFAIGEEIQDYCGDAFHTTAPPRVTYVLYHQIQGVLTGEMSIKDFLDEVDEQMEIATDKGEVWEP